MQLILVRTDSKVLLDRFLKDTIQKSSNVLTYEWQESCMRNILEEASYVSLFSEEKYVIVRNASFFGKEKLNDKDSELFLSYLEHPYPLTTLIFTTYEAVDLRKNVTKKISEVGKFVSLEAPKNYELKEEVKKLLSKYCFKDPVVKYLIEACLGNYDILVNEIQKLDLYFKEGQELELEKLKQIVPSNVNDNVFKFVDAVIYKDIYKVFQMLNDFESIKFDVASLIHVLAREYRFMYLYKILEAKKYSKIEMQKELKLQDWQVEKLRKEGELYHKEDLKDHLLLLFHLDTKLKSGEVEKNLAFKNFLIQVLEY